MNSEQIKYQQAYKRVKRIKGFYTHLLVYIVINVMILVLNYKNLDNHNMFWRWETFSMAIFWGVGLLGHGLSVFTPTFILNKRWEEKKIKELMEKEKNNKWE